MIKPVKKIFILLFSATLLFSCGGEDLPFIPNEPASINFSSRVDDATSARAEVITTGTLNDFGVYAYVDEATHTLLMENEHIYKNQGSWRYDHIKYWPENETVSFYSYSPYGNDHISVSHQDKLLNCVIPDNPDEQFDLMSAKALNRNAASGPVNLLFGHLLSRIDLVVSADTDDENIDITLDTFKVTIAENAIRNNGTFDMETGKWSLDSSTFLNGGEYDLLKSATILSDEGWNYNMILLPQEQAAGYLTVDIAYTISYNGVPASTKQASIPLSAIVCEKGKKYTYNFKILPTNLSLDIGVLPWNNSDWGAIVYPDNP